MENLIVINQSKKSDLEFELDIEGLDGKSADVRLVIKAKGYELAFPCKKAKGNKHTVSIPPMQHLDKSTYPFCITVVVDGYYFEPLKGTVNVEGSHKVYASTPETKSEKKKEVKKESVDPPKKRLSGEPSVSDVAKRIMERHNQEKQAPTPTQEPKRVVSESVEEPKEKPKKPKLDDKVRSILDEVVGRTPSQEEGTPRRFKKGGIVSI